MAKDFSFDIVSKVNFQEVANAINQAKKEAQTRFDLKTAACEVVFKEAEKQVLAIAANELALKNLVDLIKSKFIRRSVELKSIHFSPVEPIGGKKFRQIAEIVEGIPSETSKLISKDIKETKRKVNVQIEGDKLRVTSKSKDELQAIIKFLKEKDYKIPLQFINFR